MKLRLCCVLAVLALSARPSFASTIVIGGTGGANVFPFGSNTYLGEYQQIYSSTAFSAPMTITQIAFETAFTGFAITDNFTLSLGTTAATPATPGSNYAANKRPDFTTVFSGIVADPATGSGLAAVLPGRGAAFGDLDNDGRVDVVINNQDRGPTLLKNVAPAGRWISFALIGDARGPRDAIGAVVTVEAGARRLRRDIVSGSSYCSQSDFRAHFGLGDATTVDRVLVRWPDGVREAFHVPGVDRIVSLTKGQGVLAKR